MSHPGSISISLGLSKDRTVVFRVIVPNKISSKVMSSFFRHLKPSKSGASSSYADAENQSSRGSVVSASSIKSTAKNEGEAYGIHSWVEGKDPILELETSDSNQYERLLIGLQHCIYPRAQWSS